MRATRKLLFPTHHQPCRAFINGASPPPSSVHPANTSPPSAPLPLAQHTHTSQHLTSDHHHHHKQQQQQQQAMETEAFPIRFTQGVRAYWRRRKYHRLAEGADGKPRSRSRQLGGLSSGGGARIRRRVRVLLAGPRRALARARDAYVSGMLALAKRASALALPRRKQGLLPAAQGNGNPTQFEQRLIFEIYKSIVASKELTTMLHSSAAHLPPKTPAAASGVPSTHLLDM